MTREKFLKEVNRIFEVALIQKVIQMIIRAAWVGGAVYLLCWGANRLWGWLPEQSIWLMIAGSVAIIILSSAFMVREPSKKFVWRLDRGYKLQEQVYTAYELLEDYPKNNENLPWLANLMESDEIAKLPVIRREIVDRGWRLREEFESTIVVLILLLIVYLFSVGEIANVPPLDNFGILPRLGKDPTASEVFSGEGTGQRQPQDTSLLEPETIDGATPAFCEGNWDQVVEVFYDLGDELSQGSATFVIGQDLQDQRYSQAAYGFSKLAEDVDRLSGETKVELANVMLETAITFQEIGRPEISAYFQNVSAAMFEGRVSIISQTLDELATLMEICENCPRIPLKQMLANSTQQPLEITTSPGDVVDFSAFSSAPIPIGEGIIAIEQGFGINVGDDVPGYLTPFPYNLNLEDSDVVSSYFSPR